MKTHLIYGLSVYCKECEKLSIPPSLLVEWDDGATWHGHSECWDSMVKHLMDTLRHEKKELFPYGMNVLDEILREKFVEEVLHLQVLYSQDPQSVLRDALRGALLAEPDWDAVVEELEEGGKITD